MDNGAAKVTTAATEADFEARVDSAIRSAFPFLPRESIKHQTKFILRFGHAEISVDGESRSSVTGRSDIILYQNNRPIAVMELKRPSLPLTEEDVKQGLSYADVLRPRPPLVIVSNGEQVRYVESHTGAEWNATEPSEKMLAGLIESANRVAARLEGCN